MENNIKSFDKLKQYLIILDSHLKGKKYFVGKKLSLADIIIFRFLRLIMMTICTENMRDSFLKNLTKWFINIMESEEAINVYGRTILCKSPLKSFIENENNENENNENENNEDENNEDGNNEDENNEDGNNEDGNNEDENNEGVNLGYMEDEENDPEKNALMKQNAGNYDNNENENKNDEN